MSQINQAHLVLRDVYFSIYIKDYYKTLNTQDNTKLKLKPLEKLTDADGIQILILLNPEEFTHNHDYIFDRTNEEYLSIRPKNGLISTEIWYNTAQVREYNEFDGYRESQNHNKVLDYLRLHGYMTPFLKYTVNDLLNLGWIEENKEIYD